VADRRREGEEGSGAEESKSKDFNYSAMVGMVN
jgi:hypothetical protein